MSTSWACALDFWFSSFLSKKKKKVKRIFAHLSVYRKLGLCDFALGYSHENGMKTPFICTSATRSNIYIWSFPKLRWPGYDLFLRLAFVNQLSLLLIPDWLRSIWIINWTQVLTHRRQPSLISRRNKSLLCALHGLRIITETKGSQASPLGLYCSNPASLLSWILCRVERSPVGFRRPVRSTWFRRIPERLPTLKINSCSLSISKIPISSRLLGWWRHRKSFFGDNF